VKEEKDLFGVKILGGSLYEFSKWSLKSKDEESLTTLGNISINLWSW